MREVQSSLARASGRLACAVAAAFGMCAAVQAASVTVIGTVPVVPAMTVVVPTTEGPMTRAEVREAYRDARLTKRLTPAGEIGDTPEVLKAREAFNALQAEVLAQQRIVVPERVSAVSDDERQQLEAMLDQGTMTVLVLEDER